MKHLALVCAATAALAAAPRSALGQCPIVTQYNVVELTSPSSIDLHATGVNSTGKASGRYLDQSQLSDRAIRWDTPTQYVILSGTSRAYAIGDNGSVAGQTATPQGTRAARWSSTNVLTTLAPAHHGTSSYAYGVNTNNLTVGASNSTIATKWNPTSPIDLTTKMTPNPTASVAFAVNNSGIIVGYASYSTGDRRAVSWNGTTATLLTSLGGNSDTAYAISSDGRIAGAGTVAGGSFTHAIRWQSGQPLDLGVYQATHDTKGNGVNYCGTVVGDALVSDPYTDLHVALIWQNGGAMTDLNTLLPPNSGWNLLYAAAINDGGQIVGYGVRSGFTGTHAFLLTPQ